MRWVRLARLRCMALECALGGAAEPAAGGPGGDATSGRGCTGNVPRSAKHTAAGEVNATSIRAEPQGGSVKSCYGIVPRVSRPVARPLARPRHRGGLLRAALDGRA